MKGLLKMLNENKLDLKLTKYFSSNTRFCGYFMGLITGILVWNEAYMASLVLCLLTFIIFTSYYGIEIDRNLKTYREYSWILGLRFGLDNVYEGIEYIFINSVTFSQNMYYKSISSTVWGSEFVGFLKFSDGVKIRLVASRNKDVVVNKCKKLGIFLNAKIIDRTEDEFVEINTENRTLPVDDSLS